MKKRNKIALMAIASGNDTPENIASKRYVGIAACTLLAINPNKEELSKLFATESGPANIEKEPEYTGEDSTGIKYARIDMYLQTIPEKSNGITTIIKVGYFIRNTSRSNRDNTKIQVINAYGDAAWFTKEQFETKTPPENMSSYQTAGLRPAFAGEEELTKFIKRFLNIPAYSYRKSDGTIVTVPDPVQAECQLSKIPSYFNGDMSEIKKALMARKNNRLKLLFGVKTTLDNKSYQDCFVQHPVSYLTNDYKKLIEALTKTKSDNGYSMTDFGTSPYVFQEWKPTPTNAESITAPANPFGTVPQAQTAPQTQPQAIPWGATMPAPTDPDDLP